MTIKQPFFAQSLRLSLDNLLMTTLYYKDTSINTVTASLNRDNDPDIEFIDHTMDGGGYATVVRAGGEVRTIGGLERISDHTEDEESSENGHL